MGLKRFIGDREKKGSAVTLFFSINQLDARRGWITHRLRRRHGDNGNPYCEPILDEPKNRLSGRPTAIWS